ncbi:hypothetical protein AKJ43_02635 [candidate division MSBL1 archaeon SCGC-AAA261D19]|uniref:Probable tRNA sulfurtransferase n=1 Tax=candidate division MSBL1 archaeon SCGC-AAA261D19 TaxID=1698273 RepID=A0A133V6H2_9EURY|nr:hypothetical protein AKJ43_02635 [candidate division MSBL1 archaeon SCGC-AAA261D19]
MKRTILVRYNEIALKSRSVRTSFEKILIQNIERTLRNSEYELSRTFGRIYVKTSDWRRAIKRLAKVPGIASVSPARRTDAVLSKILSLAVEEAEKSFSRKGTFAVRSRRAGKHDFTSQELNEDIGREILRANPDLKVDLDAPDQEIFVEVREKDAFVFTEVVEGIGGLPVGSQGKVLAILSDAIFSPAAILLMLKRGCPVQPIFLNVPSSNKERKKDLIINASGKLKNFYPEIELLAIPFRHILRKINKKIPKKSRYVVCKRLTLRLAEIVAERVGAKAIVVGGGEERKIGVTLGDLAIIEEAVQIPILRPLAGLEKKEIKQIAREIGIARSPSRVLAPCTDAHFTKALNLEEIKKVEESLSFEDLLKQSLEGIETVPFR